NDTDELVITSAATPDVLFDCAVLSDKLTAIKPKYFTDMLWRGLRPMIVQNSSANYWHTFNLWVTNIYKGTYYCKFENVPIDNSTEFANMQTKAFYNELARMGINKLLTEEVQYEESMG
ncbi:MAG: hypothetical protein IIZ37_09840, partial [Acinetobacter sp.]|nr:hypothetical protein [Acinetobacter sp.]